MRRTPSMFYRKQDFGLRTGNTRYDQGAPDVPRWGSGNDPAEADRVISVWQHCDTYRHNVYGALKLRETRLTTAIEMAWLAAGSVSAKLKDKNRKRTYVQAAVTAEGTAL